MPIRINFLAEHQAEQAERRKDPVKLATYGVALIMALLVCWGGFLQIRLLAARSEVSSYNARFRQIEARYGEAQANAAAVADAQQRLDSLQHLAGARVLWGGGLHAMQYAAMDEVALTEFRTEQSYAVIQGTPQQTNSSGVVTTPARPAKSKETVAVTLSAVDAGARPGDLIAKFREQLESQPFFKSNQSVVKLTGRQESTRLAVSFTLRCTLAEREH